MFQLVPDRLDWLGNRHERTLEEWVSGISAFILKINLNYILGSLHVFGPEVTVLRFA